MKSLIINPFSVQAAAGGADPVSVSDDFDATANAKLGTDPNWTEYNGGAVSANLWIDNTNGDVVSVGSSANPRGTPTSYKTLTGIYSGQELTSVDHWAVEKFQATNTNGPSFGLVLRSTNVSGENCYHINFNQAGPNVKWEVVTNYGSFQSSVQTSGTFTYSPGNYYGAKVTGTGANTVIVVKDFGTTDPGLTPDWSNPDITFTNDPGAYACDTGKYVGIRHYTWTGYWTSIDDFRGGDDGYTPPTPTYDSYVQLDGVNDYISTPDSVANSVTGDIDIRVKVSVDDWSPTENEVILSKYDYATNNREWAVLILDSSALQLATSTDGTSVDLTSTVTTLGWTNGDTKWIRITRDVSATTTNFYVSTDYDPSDESGTWTSISTVSTDLNTSIKDGTSDIVIGNYEGGASNRALSGKVYYAEVRDGIDGTIVAKFNASDTTDGGSTFGNVSGETAWTNTGGFWQDANGPPDYINAVAHYKADASVFNDAGSTPATDGQTVQQWNDQTGNGNNLTQATAADRPVFVASALNGLPAIEFDDASTQNLLAGTSPITSAGFTVYTVAYLDGGNDAHLFAFVNSSASDHYWSVLYDDNTQDTLGMYSRGGSTGRQATKNVSPGEWYQFTGQEASSTSRFAWLDGAASTENTDLATPTGIDEFSVGNLERSSPAGYFDGKLAEILVYDVVHDATTRAAVESYLRNKWGLT